MRTDPFAIKKYPKWHPIRLWFTAQARLIEQEAKWNFAQYALVEKLVSSLPEINQLDYKDSALSSVAQIQHILYGLAATEHLANTVVVEVGCYRGGTTRMLAEATSRQVIAVDPYVGYGGSEADYQYFLKNISQLPNVTHKRLTSGTAGKSWQDSPIGFVFIDALHDYVNTTFDFELWSSLTVKGGILAMHDTDCLDFAGTRKAVFEAAKSYELVANPPGLTLLRKMN